MAKWTMITLLFALSCTQTEKPTGDTAGDTITRVDTVVKQDTVVVDKPALRTYANERFKDVTIEKVAVNKYLVKGRAQVFEASFSWVVEDGHNQLAKGHEMTDAGAPSWGSFAFTIKDIKPKPNSTLHLIIFEASAKDGSPQHQLVIPID